MRCQKQNSSSASKTHLPEPPKKWYVCSSPAISKKPDRLDSPANLGRGHPVTRRVARLQVHDLSWKIDGEEIPMRPPFLRKKKKQKKTLESMKVSQIFKNCPTPQKKMCETQHVQYLLTPETRLSVLRIFSCLLMSFSSQSSWPGVVEWQVATTPPQPSSDPHGWSHHQASVQVMFQVPNIVGPLMSRWHGGSRRTFYWPTSGWWIWVRDGNISWSTGFRSTHHHPSG